MAELGGTFDPGAVKDDRQLLPEGEVLAHIFESDLKATKENTGQIATFGWEIISGPLQGRKLWTRENVQNQNASAQEIGQRNLKRICEAAGIGPISNTEALHFKPMLIKIGREKEQAGYEPRNDIKGYKSAAPGGAAPPAPSGQAQASPPPPPAAGNVPWPTR
jgi:hypothetical protein